MPASRRAIYREHSPWPGWVWLVMWGPLSLALFLALASTDAPLEERLIEVAILLSVVGLVYWLLGGLTVRLYPDHLVAGLGRGVLIRTTILYADIERVEAVRYAPLQDFGGWGLRIKGNRRAWTARGDEAVSLHMRDGREIYIGSDHPDRLRERILTLGGRRIGGPGPADDDVPPRGPGA